MRPLFGVSVLGMVALGMISQTANASTAMTMGEGSECMMPPIPFVAVPIIPGANGSALGCFISTFPIMRIDLTFFAPPDPGGLSCSSTLFSMCNVTETAGITDIAFSGSPGIPTSTLFEVLLTGFSPGQKITATPNVPEPSTGTTALLATVVIALAIALSRVWRRRALFA
jgi:hypothetical protein